jgi:formylglycine-generating enzyme required for sulfatase activity
MFKLHDMLGNVSEWTCSEYEETRYLIEEKRCSERKSDSGRRVVRGGSWDDTPRLVRSADRNGREPTVRDYDLGLRLVYQE